MSDEQQLHAEVLYAAAARIAGVEVEAVTGDRLRAALESVVGVLGPGPCTCHGPECGLVHEADEALRIAQAALVDDQLLRGGGAGRKGAREC